MADTTLTEVNDQIQEFWNPVFAEELRLKQILPALVDASDRIGPQVPSQGNRIRVSQVNELTGTNAALSTCTYTTEALSTSFVDVTIDQRAYAALSFCDVVELQSQINLQRVDVREAMMRGMMNQINTYLYGLVAPTTEETGVAAGSFDAAKLTEVGQVADDAGWPEDDRWLIVDPTYYKALLDDATLTSADFGATDRPVIGGQMVLERYGWKIIKDNSAAMKAALNGAAAGVGLFFTRNFMHYIPQVDTRFKLSDAHSNNEWVIKATVDSIYGGALGVQGADRHYVVRSGA